MRVRKGAGAGLGLRTLWALLAAFACSGLNGCIYTRYSTDTSRSATEQLLVGESIRRVIEKLDLPDVDGRTVAVEIQAIPDKDTGYLRAALEARLGREGARIAAQDQAELRVVALVGAIGTVSRKASFGLPSIPLPLGETPEVPFISAVRQRAWTQVQLITRDRDGMLLAESGPVQRRARFDITTIIFFEVRRNDVYPGEGNELATE